MFNRIVFLMAVIAFLPGGCDAPKNTNNAPPQQAVIMNEALDADQFQEWMKRPGTILVDVRTPQEFAQGYIGGAVNIDFRSDQFSNEIGKLDREKTILIYCRSGNRTQAASTIMEQMGFRSIGVLKGGIVEWGNKGKLILAPVDRP